MVSVGRRSPTSRASRTSSARRRAVPRGPRRRAACHEPGRVDPRRSCCGRPRSRARGRDVRLRSRSETECAPSGPTPCWRACPAERASARECERPPGSPRLVRFRRGCASDQRRCPARTGRRRSRAPGAPRRRGTPASATCASRATGAGCQVRGGSRTMRRSCRGETNGDPSGPFGFFFVSSCLRGYPALATGKSRSKLPPKICSTTTGSTPSSSRIVCCAP